MNRNPSASPASASLGAAPMIDAEAIRSQHLSHEASVKSIGILYLLSAVFLVPAGLLMLASGRMLLVGIGALYSAFGILQGAAGIGLRKLQDRDRYVAVCVAVIGLIGIPLGTIISGYILYLLLSKKGTVVFSEDYKKVIAETPHIKHRTSIALLILLLGVLVVIYLSVIVAVLLLENI